VAVSAPLASWSGPVAWCCFAAVQLPLLLRSRYCVPVFGAILGAALLAWWLVPGDTGYPMIALLVALYTLARRRGWRSAALGGTAVLLVLSGAWLRDALSGRDLLTLTAVLVATALLGGNVRGAVRHLDRLAERARFQDRERGHLQRLAVAAERARIAREMHDVVAHDLVVMVALADGVALRAGGARGTDTELLDTLAGVGRHALDEMQRLVGVLHEDGGTAGERDPQPGLAQLAGLTGQLRRAGLPVTLTVAGVPRPRDRGVELAAYRIVQEALTNTLKHGGPGASARVRLRHTPTYLEVEVTDDGAGGTAGGTGLGIAGMIERAGLSGGVLEAGPLPGAGWRVHARLDPGRAAS
jgi:signal transduction histidine kinase